MKTNILANNTNMKGYLKYLCVVLLLIGTSASAWGATCDLYYWDKSSGAYVKWKTVDESFEFPSYDAAPYFGTTYPTAWTPATYGPTTTYPSSNNYYYEGQTYGNNGNKTTPSTLYAVYSYSGNYTSAPDVQITDPEACTSCSATVSPTSKTVNYGDAAFDISASRSGSGTITWSTSNSSVAALSNKGNAKCTVTPGSAGTATVTYSVAKQGSYCAGTATCTVTVNAIAPTLSHNTSGKALTASGITSTSVTLSGGVITNKGGAGITAYGYAVGTANTVTYGTAVKKPNAGTDDIALNTAFGSKTVTGLTPNTTYYVKAFAYNGSQRGHSNYISFTTLRRDTVVYNNNGGSGSISQQLVDRGATITLSNGSTFSKTGYTLSNWYTTSTGTSGTSYDLSDSYTSAAAKLTLYAIWSPNDYTITLNNQSATSAGTESITATYDASTNLTGTAITVPTRTGYTFGGYYTETGGSGTQIIAANGSVNASVDGYTDASKNWKYANNLVLYAKWTANSISLTLKKNNEDVSSTENGSASIDYDGTEVSSITHATRGGDYNLVGYYTDAACTAANKVLDNLGNVINSTVSGYTTSGKWIRTSDTDLYAKWSLSTYTVTFNKNGHGSDKDAQEVESGDPAVDPEMTSIVGWRFLGWYNAADGGTQWNFSSSKVTKDTTLYAHWEPISYNTETYKAWCEPDITITENIYLTSAKDVYVHGTSAAGNLLRVQSEDLSGVDKLQITYLNAAGEEIEKSACPFLFCQNGTSSWAEITTQINVSASNELDTTFSIKFSPAAYDSIYHNKLRITMKRGTRELKTVTCDLWGRSLPEEFVIAVKSGSQWYALPNDLATTSAQPSIVPIKIVADPSGVPTKAKYAAENTVYKATGRNQPTKYRAGIRFTTTGKNYLQTAKANSAGYYNMWLSTSNTDSAQVWYLQSSDLSAYTLKMDAKHTDAKKMGIYTGGYMGFHGSPLDYTIYLLPIENKYEDWPAIVTEWGKKSVILDVDARSAAKVSAHINNASPEEATSFGETKTSVLGADSKYNYSLSFSTLDFSANKDSVLYFDWMDEDDNLLACSQVTIPWIIASSGTMSTIDGTKGHWDTEVHVLPGVTLTADGGSFASKAVVIKQMEIYPGATVKVTTDTLNVKNLILRYGWTRAGTKEYDVARLHIANEATLAKPTNAYADWYIDFDQYYPVAVPWEVDLGSNDGSKITYKNTKSKAIIGSTTSVRLRYYDGASRATSGQTGVGAGANWKLYGAADCTAIPAKLEPGKGYAMTAKRPTGKAFSIIRMPLTIPSATWTLNGEKGEVSSTHKDQVSVTAHGVSDASKPSYTVGWNFIANPYMALYSTKITHSEGSTYDVTYVNIPDIDFKEYGQYDLALSYKLLPASGFFIQAGETGTLTFVTTNRSASAPSYRKDGTTPVVEEQKAYIVLNNDNGEDVMGLKISENYTADYEINADLEKLLGDGTSLKTYMHYGDMNMAYVAINQLLAQEWIPVSVRIPEIGEYTFSLHEASVVDELEGVYLIDYYSGDYVTNLLDNDYVFYSPKGTISNRFAINAKVGERETPTNIDVIGVDKNGDGPIKFLWHDKVFIWFNGVIYDATGKKVR